MGVLIAPRLIYTYYIHILIIACTPRASRQPDKEKPHMLHNAFLSGNRYCPLYLVPCFSTEPAYLQPLAPSMTQTTTMTLLYIITAFSHLYTSDITSTVRLEHFLDKCHAVKRVARRQMLRNEARLVMLVPHPSRRFSAAAHISLSVYRNNMIGRMRIVHFPAVIGITQQA